MNLTRDRRSKHFVWQDRSAAPRRFLSQAQVDAFDRDGFFVVEGVLRGGDLDAVRGEVDALEAEIERTVLTFETHDDIVYGADQMTFLKNPVTRSRRLRALYRGEAIAGVAYDLLGPDVRLYWDQAVYKKPEKGREFPWHQDNGYTFVEPQIYVTCWLALADTTVENGCPWVIPGLHRLGVLEHGPGDFGLEITGIRADPALARQQAVPVRGGDMVVFSSLTPHMTGPNLTRDVRKALIVQLVPDGACLVGADGSRVPQTDPIRNLPIVSSGGVAV